MFKVLKNGTTPTKGSKYSSAVDLYASDDVVIGAGETVMIGLGACIDLVSLFASMQHNNYFGNCSIGNEPEFEDYCNKAMNEFLSSHYLELHPRSSLREKGLISNTGIIDLDYEGEIKIIIHNPTTVSYEMATDTSGHVECDDNFTIKKGDRIAQILLKEHKNNLFGIESEDERL